MSVLELAKKYYPRLWDKQRIEALVEAGRLTGAQAEEVMGPETEKTAPPVRAAEFDKIGRLR